MGYRGVGVEEARSAKPETDWFGRFVEGRNDLEETKQNLEETKQNLEETKQNLEEGIVNNLENAGNDLAEAIVSKADAPETAAFMAPPQILQTLICPDGSGSIAMAGNKTGEVNIVRMFIPPAPQLVVLALVSLCLVSVLYFATTALDADEPEDPGVLDSFSSFQERKLNTGLDYNSYFYQYGNLGRRRKRSDEEHELTAGLHNKEVPRVREL